jgi:hypothetical protein
MVNKYKFARDCRGRRLFEDSVPMFLRRDRSKALSFHQSSLCVLFLFCSLNWRIK